MKLEIEKFHVAQFKVGDIILVKNSSSSVFGSYYLVGRAPPNITGGNDKFGVVLINLKDPENTYELDSLSHIGNIFEYNRGWRIEKFIGKVTLIAE